jgi:hypothetical protein
LKKRDRVSILYCNVEQFHQTKAAEWIVHRRDGLYGIDAFRNSHADETIIGSYNARESLVYLIENYTFLKISNIRSINFLSVDRNLDILDFRYTMGSFIPKNVDFVL